MSPPAASWLNRSSDSSARWPLRSPGWKTSHDQLGELLLSRLSTRQVRDTDLLDRHGSPPRERFGKA
jgi:hypothetical protein